jgi:hypothetical protein
MITRKKILSRATYYLAIRGNVGDSVAQIGLDIQTRAKRVHGG